MSDLTLVIQRLFLYCNTLTLPYKTYTTYTTVIILLEPMMSLEKLPKNLNNQATLIIMCFS